MDESHCQILQLGCWMLLHGLVAMLFLLKNFSGSVTSNVFLTGYILSVLQNLKLGFHIKAKQISSVWQERSPVKIKKEKMWHKKGCGPSVKREAPDLTLCKFRHPDTTFGLLRNTRNNKAKPRANIQTEPFSNQRMQLQKNTKLKNAALLE